MSFIDRLVPNVVVIPTKDHYKDLCAGLVRQLLTQPELEHIYVLDNNEEALADPGYYEDAYGRVTIVHCPLVGIYRMWNDGWDLALRHGPEVNLAILNDDIKIPHHFLARLSRGLRNYDFGLVYPNHTLRVEDDPWDYGFVPHAALPFVTTGTYRDGGMCGWAFMVRAELRRAGLARIDEQFEWWCGDDDLARQLGYFGWRQAMLPDLPLDHESEATAVLNPWTHEAKARDMRRFELKYSGGW